MIQPSLEEIPFVEDSETLFDRLRHLPGAVWLDSGKPRSGSGRYDILAALPRIVITTDRTGTIVREGDQSRRVYGDMFRTAWEILENQGLVAGKTGALPFAGGLIGYFGYDLGRHLHGLPDRPGEPDAPRMQLGWYGTAVVVDHREERSWLVTHPACDRGARDRVRDAVATPDPADGPGRHFRLGAHFLADQDRDTYRRAIKRIKAYIEAGDCYQVNYALRHSAPFAGDPWEAYRTLRRALPSPYSAYMDWNGTALLSLSPECFLRVDDGIAESRPIKGTVARGKSIEADRALAQQLLDSDKDRAENLMIVDLLRNDLSRNCAAGSVRVPKLFELESYANVHHLVSTVTGQLASGRTPLDLLRDAFPGGSITGAPKRRAMEIIDELEPACRDIYCGSIGYISACGTLDTSIAIRTLLARDKRLYCWGGGGIVADSDPETEYAEALQKVNVLMRALEAKEPE